MHLRGLKRLVRIIGPALLATVAGVWVLTRKPPERNSSEASKPRDGHADSQQESSAPIRPAAATAVDATLGKAIAVLLFVSTALLIGGWVDALVSNLSRGALLIEPFQYVAPRVVQIPTVPGFAGPAVAPGTVGASTLSDRQVHNLGLHATVIVDVRGLTVRGEGAATLHCVLHVAIPNRMFTALVDRASSLPVATLPSDAPVQVRPRFGNVALSLHIVSQTQSGVSVSEPSRVDLPLGGFSGITVIGEPGVVGGEGVPTMDVPLDLGAIGSPVAYPFDSYFGIGHMSLTFPVSLSYQNPSFEISGFLPLDVRFAVSTLGLRGAVTQDTQGIPTGGSGYFVKIERDGQTRWGIILSLLIPFSFFLILIHALFLTNWGRGARVHELLFSIAAVLFTVVPLRTIVVPPSLQGQLTRFDILLGFLGTLVIGLVFVRYGTQILRAEHGTTEQEADA